MKVVKFGGKSLANGNGIKNTLEIIKSKVESGEKFVVVLSARGSTTNELESILEIAQSGKSYTRRWEALKMYQLGPYAKMDFSKEFDLLSRIFEGVKMVEDCSDKVKDLILAQGEIMSTKLVAHMLNEVGVKARAVDSRSYCLTDSSYGYAKVNQKETNARTKKYFKTLPSDTLAITTGYIAADADGNTTTLGRNGSNYSASLLAKDLEAKEVESYTHVDGIYTADPMVVPDATIIEQLSYDEATELASFGASILHAKTILPLVQHSIPLRIKNTFNPDSAGTLVTKEQSHSGVKSISVQKSIGLIHMEGKGLLGNKGVDGRIFSAMSNNDINVSLINQGSSERNVSFVIDKEDVNLAIEKLEEEFAYELHNKDIVSISQAAKNASVITVVGQSINDFSRSFDALLQNKIPILLINNTMNGKNISLVVKNKYVDKAINVVHSQIFGVATHINIAIFGKGTVGGSLIKQILASRDKILNKKETLLNIFAIAGSQKVILDKDGLGKDWKEQYQDASPSKNNLKEVIRYAKEHNLVNLVAIDNTASSEFIASYLPLIEQGFDLISSNKIANTLSYKSYKKLRKATKKHKKTYLYETNVGAGLPIIDTIRILHESGENITRIRGVFSGTLSYLFNEFSAKDEKFSSILETAIEKGYTEPDPREDLCGNDVARKLLILARELDLENEFDEIKIHNLIPEHLREGSTGDFLKRLKEFDPIYAEIKKKQKKDHVLSYVADLSGDLQKSKGKLSVELVSVPSTTALGQLKGSDSIFEIYTESYGDNPITIIGAGAGAEVTARGVFGDLLRIAEKK